MTQAAPKKCACAVSRAADKEGNPLRHTIELLHIGGSKVAKMSTRQISAWLESQHGVKISFQVIAFHMANHYEEGKAAREASRPPPPTVETAGEEDLDQAEQEVAEAIRNDLATLDEITSISMNVLRHVATELTSLPATAAATAEPEAEGAKKKGKGRPMSNVYLFEYAGNMAVKAIKTKRELIDGKKINLQAGLDTKGLLPLLRQMGQNIPQLEGDRPMLLEQGEDGIFNPAMMPRDEAGLVADDALAFASSAAEGGDDAPQDGAVT